MELFVFAVGVVAVLVLGLAAGALLAEGCVLVPFWQSQAPASFLSWYEEHAGLLLKFFGSLEIASTVAIITLTGLAFHADSAGVAYYGGSMALNLAVLASFPMYFKKANARFADGSIPQADVPAELVRWSKWHWVRTGLSVGAFVLAVLGLAL